MMDEDAWMRFVAIRFPDHYRPRPDVDDFARGLVGVIERERERVLAESGGQLPARCMDRGHEFWCRFPSRSCLFGMCNDDEESAA